MVIITLLDKAWPPSHSFVDGMLANVVSREPDIKVRLCVSRSGNNTKTPIRYKNASCLPALHPRRGIFRFLNLVNVYLLVRYQLKRERKRGHDVVLFVRNDPIYLLAASLLRKRADRLVFQSSFPHEEYSGNPLKRWVARTLLRVGGIGVDVVTGVSPEGVKRTGRLCPNAVLGPHIPLLSDLHSDLPTNFREKERKSYLTFIYAGTHRPERNLEFVLSAIVKALDTGVCAHFQFVGATPEDRRRLCRDEDVASYVEKGAIMFRRPVERHMLPKIMANADIGISLIPLKDVYYESSPTKLAEYMGAGLAVLASRGIPMQERFVNESQAGVLVDWDIAEITEAIQRLSRKPEDVTYYQANAKQYVGESLQYKKYMPQFRQLLHPRS